MTDIFKLAAVAALAFTLVLSCKKDEAAPADIPSEQPVDPATVPTTVAEPDSYVVAITDFTTTRGTLKIGGKLYMPKALVGKKPAIVMCHGLFGNYVQMEPYARAAAAMGIASVCFDFCGGPAGKSLSDGDVARDNSVLTEVEDVMAVYNAISIRDDIDPSRIVVMGMSQGGLVSALFAAKYPEKVKALGLLFPAFNLPDCVRFAVDTFFCEDPTKVPEGGVGIAVGKSNFTFSKKYVVDAYGLEPYKLIGNYTGNVEILHGTADFIVPVKFSEDAVTIYKDVHLDDLDGQGHLFNKEGVEQAIGILQKWFPKVLPTVQ